MLLKGESCPVPTGRSLSSLFEGFWGLASMSVNAAMSGPLMRTRSSAREIKFRCTVPNVLSNVI